LSGMGHVGDQLFFRKNHQRASWSPFPQYLCPRGLARILAAGRWPGAPRGAPVHRAAASGYIISLIILLTPQHPHAGFVFPERGVYSIHY